MKKLMIMVLPLMMAAVCSAATVTWSTSTCYKPTSATDGTFMTGLANHVNPANFYVWILGTDAAAQTTFNNLAVSDIYSKYSSKIGEASIGTVESYKGGFTSPDTYTAGQNVYAVLLTTYKDGSGNDWYVANKAYGTIGATSPEGDNITIGDLQKTIGGSGNAGSFTGSGATITGWTAVPEPTSGLLLLCGLAGLMLRRKQKKA